MNHVKGGRCARLTLLLVAAAPLAGWDAANGDVARLPSLHSPFWAADAEAVISTATEAMVVAAMGVLRRR
jgi:hippurate hydrolase